MDVSIIIVNYYTSKLINDCIESIFKYTRDLTYEIIIVDNASEDLGSSINYASNKKVKLLQLSENLGFGKANNAGASIATGEYLFLLNPDTLLNNNAVKILSNYIDTNPKCGACGGNLFDNEKKPTMSFHRKLPGILWEFDDLLNTFPLKILYGKNRIFNYSKIPISVKYIQGADIMISNSLFKQLGGFSDEFFMYYEETDLCRRIAKAGYKLISVPSANIVHYESASFVNDDAFERKWKMIYTSRMIYLHRVYGKIRIKITNYICRLFLFSRCILTRNPIKRRCYKIRFRLFRESIKNS